MDKTVVFTKAPGHSKFYNLSARMFGVVRSKADNIIVHGFEEEAGVVIDSMHALRAEITKCPNIEHAEAMIKGNVWGDTAYIADNPKLQCVNVDAGIGRVEVRNNPVLSTVILCGDVDLHVSGCPNLKTIHHRCNGEIYIDGVPAAKMKTGRRSITVDAEKLMQVQQMKSRMPLVPRAVLSALYGLKANTR